MRLFSVVSSAGASTRKREELMTLVFEARWGLTLDSLVAPVRKFGDSEISNSYSYLLAIKDDTNIIVANRRR